jgi:hypothetical protein
MADPGDSLESDRDAMNTLLATAKLAVASRVPGKRGGRSFRGV